VKISPFAVGRKQGPYLCCARKNEHCAEHCAAEHQFRTTRIKAFRCHGRRISPMEHMTSAIPPWIATKRDGKLFVELGGEWFEVDPEKPPVFLFPSYLASKLPSAWSRAQEGQASDDRHVLVQWMSDFAALLAEYDRAGIISEYPGGLNWRVKALLLLAYDMYTLDKSRALQQAVLARLTDPTTFQSARFELAVAAVMIRAGFDLAFEDESDSSRKHAEFIATERTSGTQIAVEAKSIHREGILGSTIGKPPPTPDTATAHKIAAQIAGQVERALPKAHDHPLYVFVDLNLPPNVAEQVATGVLPELEGILPQVDSGYDRNGVSSGKIMNLLVATNWSVHLGEERHQEGDSLNFFVNPKASDCRYPDGSHYIHRIKLALKNYGSIIETA